MDDGNGRTAAGSSMLDAIQGEHRSSNWLAEVQALRRRMDRNAHGHISQALRLKLSNDIATFITTIGGAALMALSSFLLFYPMLRRP